MVTYDSTDTPITKYCEFLKEVNTEDLLVFHDLDSQNPSAIRRTQLRFSEATMNG